MDILYLDSSHLSKGSPASINLDSCCSSRHKLNLPYVQQLAALEDIQGAWPLNGAFHMKWEERGGGKSNFRACSSNRVVVGREKSN